MSLSKLVVCYKFNIACLQWWANANPSSNDPSRDILGQKHKHLLLFNVLAYLNNLPKKVPLTVCSSYLVSWPVKTHLKKKDSFLNIIIYNRYEESVRTVHAPHLSLIFLVPNCMNPLPDVGWWRPNQVWNQPGTVSASEGRSWPSWPWPPPASGPQICPRLDKWSSSG